MAQVHVYLYPGPGFSNYIGDALGQGVLKYTYQGVVKSLTATPSYHYEDDNSHYVFNLADVSETSNIPISGVQFKINALGGDATNNTVIHPTYIVADAYLVANRGDISYTAGQLLSFIDIAYPPPPVPEIITTAMSVAETTLEVGYVSLTNGQIAANYTWSISGGADAALFDISASGRLVFKALHSFTLNGDNEYVVTVRASGGGGFDEQSIVVTVLNSINDAPVHAGSSSLSAAENASSAGTVTATDADGDAIVYSISGGDDQALFDIDGTTGAISFKSAPDFENPTDADSNNDYELIITASDGVNATQRSYTVSVTNVNEPPVITSTASFTIAENTTEVGDVTANDPENDALTYSITGGVDAAKFSIDPITGKLEFIVAPDFENPGDM